MIDTHAHLYLEEFKEDMEEVILRAMDAGVERILLPNIDESTIDPMLELHQKYPNLCYPALGLHPCSVTKEFEKQLYQIESYFDKGTYYAIGEIGTDLYWDKSLWEHQKEAFMIQSQWGIEKKLPVIIHARESINETIDMVEKFDKKLKGVFHCFTGTVAQAKQIEEQGLYFGIGGIITYKNTDLYEVVKTIAKEKIIIETDAPYLSPLQERKTKNEPYKLKYVVEKLADSLQISQDEVVKCTTDNALRLFF